MSEYFRRYIKKEHYPVHYSQLKYKTYFTNCVVAGLTGRLYQNTQDDDWDIYWVEKHLVSETLDKIRLYPNKRINHFKNFHEICRKDLLCKNIKRYKRALQKEGKAQQALTYSYLPLTYNLPSQYSLFYEEYKRRQKNIWIMKPIGLSQGKGIFLFKNINDIEQWSDSKNQPEPYIVQMYIHNPLLIGHKKFDLRIYVLVTSHTNLTIYLYRSGFGRFTHRRYDSLDINDLESHLTNVAIQKNSENYDDERGGKYLLDKLRIYLLSKYGSEPTIECFNQIQQLIIKTLQSTAKLIIGDKRCFELYGFDILIDSNLKPWLMQVNGSPSMTANTPTDTRLKIGLLDDTISIINLQQLLTGEQDQVGGFDLIYKNKRVKKENRNYSMLGTLNNRQYFMRKMAKAVALRLAEKPKQEKDKKANSFNDKQSSKVANNILIRNRNLKMTEKVKLTNNLQIFPTKKNIEIIRMNQAKDYKK